VTLVRILTMQHSLDGRSLDIKPKVSVCGVCVHTHENENLPSPSPSSSLSLSLSHTHTHG